MVSSCIRILSMDPHFGVVPAGVTGLLFENYIVDASILKQFFDEPGSAVLLFWGVVVPLVLSRSFI